MVCKSCGSENQSAFGAETSLVRTGRDFLNFDPVYSVQEATICLECGFLELVIPKPALAVLKGPPRARVSPTGPSPASQG